MFAHFPKMNHRLTISAIALLTLAAHAGRSSQDYSIVAETLDYGGKTVTSETYAIHGSVATVGEVTEGSAPLPVVCRSGYIGQLYQRLGLGMLAADFYPSETATTQLLAVHTNDDGTNDPIPADKVVWSVLAGPVTGIDAAGLATTGAVFGDSEAQVRGTVFGTPLDLTIYVLDSLSDNFGSYAGDGLDDSWQFLHFGMDNPLAAPWLDPDGDGQNNQFEYTAGIIPTDPLSRFLLSIEPVPGEPTHRNLRFSPVFGDRTYTVKSNTTLEGGVWEDLTDFADDNNNPERMVTDQDATPSMKFYQVEIIKP